MEERGSEMSAYSVTVWQSSKLKFNKGEGTS